MGEDFSNGRFTGVVRRVRPGRLAGTYTVQHADASVVRDSDDSVGITLSLTAGHRVRFRSGRLADDARPAVGTATVCVPGEWVRVDIVGEVRVLRAELGLSSLVAHVEEECGADPARLAFRGALHADDPALSRLLFDALTGGRDGGAAERALAVHLHAAYAGGRMPRRLGGIAPGRLRRLLAFIEEAPPDEIDLRSLSARAGMSPFHFAREFKGTVGEPPMRFVARRLALRGLSLLSDPRTSVGEAASRAGFAHPSHLARHARRLTGVTPARFRADVLA